MKNSPRETLKINTQDMQIKKIEELEIELTNKDKVLKSYEEELSDLKQQLLEIMADKKEITDKIHKLEIMEIEAKLKNYESLQEDLNKIKHRNEITKNQLDTAREDIITLKNVISDLEKRGLWDYLLGRFPESYKKYKKI